ncbi:MULTISPECIES: dihydroxyacetone kinase phosphoryl donor subunit DhaM [Microbacterium]|uniref:Phosphocarrier protein HPr n=1 Tax=Microbacterium wangchenii TaxID=2541726 RepID=A0ABX5SSR4_9MICO|nr:MULTISPECIES: dihydroxyacetone kinase phosphoryl donor subunit DhaM [Microbacterium]MCK6066952.1 HPr family phosphocarrier protein [Microbacterium sp. EYE_512]QBR88251.1 HPr family phosphocarrier protein [Microbacterium wangchenii]TXK17959.1 HPr family phosphocarrier protein [Microbacterium wangchenii]
MIGIVVVSHSAPLAAAAVDLALQMGGDSPPPIDVAAGTADAGFGTDAAEIAAAIDRVASDDGVLVLMDLGSAILSAEMAREFVQTDARIVLSPAPFVEGLVAAVVAAAAGSPLETVATQVRGALDAKRAQLGEDSGAAGAESAAPGGSPAPSSDGQASFEAVIRNPSGLHARPAAAFVRAVGRFDARVQVADLDAGSAPAAGDSLLALMSLGVRPGTRIRVSATGPQAQEAVDELRTMVEDGFGEL